MTVNESMLDGVMICGGAGYIGSHTARYLTERHSCRVIIVDNLLTGHRQSLPEGIPFYHGDIRDEDFLVRTMRLEKITSVVHFAASSIVSESCRHPSLYFRNNVGGALSLLEAMRRAGVNHIVFSSTAAVYGQPHEIPLSEDHPCEPINPYGESKLFIEKMLRRYAEAYGISSVSLRYFNACGAWPGGLIGEDHRPETHLIPLVAFAAMGLIRSLSVFGTDYSTRDGTAIRDYIHVLDLAEAHIKALHFLASKEGAWHFNLGNGTGFSVKEIITTFEHCTGGTVPVINAARRVGDPAILVADYTKAKEVLGWVPRNVSLEDMITSAWDWHRMHPDGYAVLEK